MLTVLREARLKVKRANEHIQSLNALARKFAESDRYKIVVEHSPGKCDTLYLESTAAIPDDFLLILGDALHNLRASLDFAMHAVSTRQDKHTKFPIRENRKELVAAVNGGMKEKTSQRVRTAITDSIQPYKSGRGNLLWVLHQLDIEDKHRLLIASVKLTLVRNISAKDDKGERFTIPDWLIVPDHRPSYSCEGHQNITIMNKGSASLAILFGEGMAFQGQMILSTLHDIEQAVVNSLGILENAFSLIHA